MARGGVLTGYKTQTDDEHSRGGLNTHPWICPNLIPGKTNQRYAD